MGLADYRDNTLQLGMILLTGRSFAEAEEALLESVRLLDEHPDLTGYWDFAILPTVVELYETWAEAEPGSGHEEEAVRWRERLPDTTGG